MKSKLLRGVFLASVVGFTAWIAKSTEGSSDTYLETFDDLSYSNKVPVGWVYQADDRSGYENYYLSTSSNYGIGNSKALSFGSQVLEEEYEYDDDYMRSPAKAVSDDLSDCRYAIMITLPVAGEVSFYARTKNSYDKEFIRIYDVTESDGKYTPLTETPISYTESVETFTSQSRDTEWTKITFDAGETPKRVALHFSNKYVDNFSAERAVVPQVYSLNIYSFGVNGSSKNLYCDEEGNVTIPVKFKLENKGNVTLTPGMENYSVTFSANSKDIYTWNVDTELAPKAEKEFTVDIPYKMIDPKVDEKGFSVKARENISGGTTYGETFQLYSYNPVCEVYESGADRSVSALDLGLFSGSKDVELRFFNKGAAPLEVSALIMDESVTCNLDLPVTIQAGEKLPFTLTFTGPQGVISGEIAIASNGTGTDNKTKMSYSGSIVAEGTYLATFDDAAIPEGWILPNTSSWKTHTQSNNQVLYSATDESNVGKIITKKIEFADGDKLNMSFAGSSFYGSSSPWLKVYYSTDRSNWILAQEFIGASNGGDYAYPSPNYKNAQIDIPQGEYYVALEAYKTYVDHVFGGKEAQVLHDLYLSDFSAPSSAMVNYPVRVSVKVKNMASDIEDAANYTVSLLHGENVVASAQSEDLENGVDPLTFNFSFIPHATTDELPLKVEFSFTDDSGYVVCSESKPLSVSGEVMISDVQIGTVGTTYDDYSSSFPICGMYKNSLSLCTYKPELVPLSAGERIKKLSFVYEYSATENVVRNMRVWVANGTDKTVWNDSTTMTSVLSEPVTFTTTPKDIADKYAKFDIEIPEGFVYEGNGLQIMTRSEASAYKSTSWACFKTEENGISKYLRNDTYNGYKEGNVSTDTKLPVLILSLDKKAVTLSGTVSSNHGDSDDAESTPLAGAVVRMEGDGLLYEAVTDENGLYELPIYQPTHQFTGAFMAVGHKDMLIEPAEYAESVEIPAILEENVVDSDNFAASKNPQKDTQVSLSWNHVTPGTLDAEKEISYAVYVNGTKIGETVDNFYEIEDISKLDLAARSISYQVGVTAKYGDHESSPVYVSIDTTGVNGVELSNATVYAVDGQIIISSDADMNYTVVTTDGLKVADGETYGDGVSVKVQPDVYIVTLVKGSSSISQKILVK